MGRNENGWGILLLTILFVSASAYMTADTFAPSATSPTPTQEDAYKLPIYFPNSKHNVGSKSALKSPVDDCGIILYRGLREREVVCR